MKILTSIIIITYNQLKYTQECIASIRQYTEAGTYELIVIDNNSTDGTQEWLSSQQDILSVLNTQNFGFPKGCNQGIALAKGETVLLLNNDTVVTPRWLELLLERLYSDECIAAVGPVTNNMSNYQQIQVPYKTIDEMITFADQYNKPDDDAYEYRLRLMGFCLLMKKQIIEQIGFLDERFSPGNYEDDDLSYRIIEAGYHLVLCKNVFIHHYGSVSFGAQNDKYTALLKKNKQKFIEKWGFESGYSSFIRNDIIQLINPYDKNSSIRVLEIGCACGGTLLGIKSKYRNAELHGIEINKAAAIIASNFANVRIANVENQLDYPPKHFDYILLPDVLEHLTDPWNVLRNLVVYLKDNGKIIASIPNVMHYSVLKEVLNGRWYKDSGIMDNTHLRFFTLHEIDKMFRATGCQSVRYHGNTLTINDEDQRFVDGLVQLSQPELREQFIVYQYLVEACSPHFDSFLQKCIERFDAAAQNENDLINLLDATSDGNVTSDNLISIIDSLPVNRIKILNQLAVIFYNNRHYNLVIPLLQHALEIDNLDEDSLYNLGYFLYRASEYELSLYYLEQIPNKDQDINQLIIEVQQNKLEN
ncbi:bifunctional glycosyltransferase family 2 protein/class I SAM-dependent methyltransferase [Paenibacillus caui]|uniref:bifunctional glycosyltransferase family 2 protein/class I SAM-dependent methyltransferase n=1 Tax=Paenibacillus caui TaxID=2873927 RepID=UPI001CA8C7FD|nr:bifunctional glycosyltransferase family 2 protein/class I SAM-dependent methyltransferase [Paenibacillus caui]